MDFIQELQLWEKAELLQGKIIIGIGLLILVAFIGIFRSQNELLRGMLIPFSLLILVLIGYGRYILQSRPTHVKQSISLYEKSTNEAIQKEIEKHTNDNKAGKILIKYVYPSLIIISAVALFLISSLYFKGMVIGFILLFASTFIIDNGFVTRSNKVIEYITTQK